MEFSGFYVAHGFRLLHPRACTHRVRNTGYVLHTLGCCAKHNLQNRCKRNWKTIFKGNLFSFGACAKKHMAYRKKYKPCILKYKALILKYVPYIFCCNKNLKHNNLQKCQDSCLFLDFQYFAKKAVFYAFSAGVNCCAGNGLPHFPASSACRVLPFTGFLIC